MKTTLLTAALACAAIVGCADTGADSPFAVAPAGAPAAAVDGPVAGVTGAAQFHPNANYRRMEITARRSAGGAVSGELQWVAGAAIIHGRITCLTVIGNTAWVGGVVTDSKFAIGVDEGSEFEMAIVDRGEGQALPDQTTLRPFQREAGSAAAFCAAADAPVGLTDMEHGNIQVWSE